MEIVHVFVSNSFIKENALFLNKIQINKNNIIEVSDKLFNTISDTVTPQGVLAVCKQKMFSLNDVLSIKEGFFIILEEIQDPGNLGTIIRTADAAGVDAIFITKEVWIYITQRLYALQWVLSFIFLYLRIWILIILLKN